MGKKDGEYNQKGREYNNSLNYTELGIMSPLGKYMKHAR